MESVPLSALQHFLYCPRQCALIHVEQTFEENLYTLRGARVHENAHSVGHELVAGRRFERSLPLFSEHLGLTGRSDIVEFDAHDVPYPVEYKAGKRKNLRADEVQLCAQAMCLEEMLDVRVPEGSIFYHSSRRRTKVAFTEELRSLVERTTHAVREILVALQIPPPVHDARCRHCSLNDSCLPAIVAGWSSTRLSPFKIEDDS